MPVDLSGDVKAAAWFARVFQSWTELRTGSGDKSSPTACTDNSSPWNTLYLGRVTDSIALQLSQHQQRGRDYRFEWKGVWGDRTVWQLGGWGCDNFVNSEEERKAFNKAFDANSAGEDMFDKIGVGDKNLK